MYGTRKQASSSIKMLHAFSSTKGKKQCSKHPYLKAPFWLYELPIKSDQEK
jgi:hypothetical protein